MDAHGDHPDGKACKALHRIHMDSWAMAPEIPPHGTTTSDASPFDVWEVGRQCLLAKETCYGGGGGAMRSCPSLRVVE